MSTNQGFKTVVFDNESVDPSFYFYFFQTLLPEMKRRSSGTTFLEISAKEFGGIRIPVPRLAEQRRIAEILDAMDQAIRSTDRLIGKLEYAKQGLLQDCLTRGVDETGHVRSPATSAAEFTASPVGLRPSSWSVAPLGDHIRLQRGFDITVAEQVPGDVPVVSSSGVSSFHDRAMVPGPGVVVGRKGKLGDSYYIPSAFWPHDTTLWVKAFGGNEPKFVAMLLKSMRLERLDAATSVPTLNRNFVHPVLVAMPPDDEQRRIVKIVEIANRRVMNELAYLAKLRLLKQGLVEDVLTQRVQVSTGKDIPV